MNFIENSGVYFCIDFVFIINVYFVENFIEYEFKFILYFFVIIYYLLKIKKVYNGIIIKYGFINYEGLKIDLIFVNYDEGVFYFKKKF